MGNTFSKTKLEKNNSMFEMDVRTGEIRFAEVESLSKCEVRVTIRQGYLYLSALNVTNAKRKFTQRSLKLLQSMKANG